ncbi:MAG: hypothetical protein ABEH38_07900, partial [Flavobacteriales bacterium]
MATEEGFILYDPIGQTVTEINAPTQRSDIPNNNSNKTEGRFLYLMPEYVEHEPYFQIMSQTPECCATNSIGNDLVHYRARNDATWDPTSNPFGNSLTNTVWVRDSLVIGPDVNVEINNMTFLMGEDAEIVLKRGAELDAEN